MRHISVDPSTTLGEAIIAVGLPLEQPCAGKGTCFKCKVLAQGDLSPLDEREQEGLTSAERAAGYRLACRARVQGDVSVTLAPILVYSNKIFRASDEYKRGDAPLGLAIDLGSTTVAAFVTTLDEGQVCTGAAALNQQTAFGADVISRLAAAQQGDDAAERVSMLALASIVQAIDALKLSRRVEERIRKATIVGNCAMHHLLLRYPVESLSALPFQPYKKEAVRRVGLFGDVFPPGVETMLPPLIGGFVGSDALACLAYYDFDRTTEPIAAIDLGTNGEVMVADGQGRILVASTAAGPAFEGVNISCGSRAVDGAIVGVTAQPETGDFAFETIADAPPVGLTGSGLLDLICQLRRVGVIDAGGRMVDAHPTFGHRIDQDERGVRRILLNGSASESEIENGPLYLTQQDVRELQKAKGAILAATATLLERLGLRPGDLQRMILTGSFGSQLNVEAVIGLGMIPSVSADVVETSANGAGFGAALFLDDEAFARGERIALQAEQVDLDLDPGFIQRYVEAMALPGQPEYV